MKFPEFFDVYKSNDALSVILNGQWWRLFFLGLLISLLIFAFNAFGDGLQNALDPSTNNHRRVFICTNFCFYLFSLFSQNFLLYSFLYNLTTYNKIPRSNRSEGHIHFIYITRILLVIHIKLYISLRGKC